jgi:hypothetical protein
MIIEIITKEDLKGFKTDLLNDIHNLIKNGSGSPKEWLKGTEVRRLLKISPGTLQNLRIKRSLSFSKVGGTYYYKYGDVMRMLENNSSGHK